MAANDGLESLLQESLEWTASFNDMEDRLMSQNHLEIQPEEADEGRHQDDWQWELIEQIRTYPCIWNVQCRAYK